MKTRAFVISSAISATLQSLYTSAVSVVSLFLLGPMMQNLTVNPTSGPPTGFSNYMGLSMLITGAGFLLAPVAYIATGFLYAWLHRREDHPVTAEQGAIGGAAAAATARFVTGIVQGVISLLVSSVMYQNIISQVGPLPGGTPGMPFVVGIGMMSGVVGGVIGTCFGAFLAGAMGAIGGGLAGAMLK